MFIRLFCLLCSFVFLISCQSLHIQDIANDYSNINEVYPNSKVALLAKAAANENKDKVQQLIKQGVDVNSVGIDGVPVLFWPFREQSYKGMEILLQLGADPHYEGEEGFSILSFAAEVPNSKYLSLLLKYGATPDFVNTFYVESLLEVATSYNNKDHIDLLLDKGANINLRTDNGNTPIFESPLNGYSTVLYLVERGADPTIRNEFNKTIFHYFKQRLIHPEPGQEEYDAYKKLMELQDKLGIKVKGN